MGKRISVVTAIGTDVITEASQLPITDAGEHYDSSTVEGALEEVGSQLSAIDTQVAETISNLKRKPNYPGAISIVFDDGLIGNYLYAYPLLKKYNTPATFAISSAKIGTTNYLTVAQMQSLHLEGLIDFADHEYNHTPMTDMTEQQIKDNLLLTREFFMTTIGEYPTTLVYPGGYRNNLIRNVLYPLYRRVRSTADAQLTPIMYRNGQIPWELPWVGFHTTWFSNVENYIGYIRKMVKAGLYVVPSLHNINNTESLESVMSSSDLEKFLKFIRDENIEVIPINGLSPHHNKVKDPSFEEMPTGALIVNMAVATNGNIGATWDKDGANPNIVIDDTVSRSGKKSLKFYRTNGDGLVQNIVRAFVPVDGTGLQRLSFWYKGSHTTGSVVNYNISGYDELGVWNDTVLTANLTCTTDWQLFAVDFVPSSKSKNYRVAFSMPQPSVSEVGERSIWVDDVCFNNTDQRRYNEIRS